MPGWEVHFDDSDFYANASYVGYWDTDHWVACGEDETYLMENGTWNVDYRPTKFRLTFTGAADIALYVYQKNSNIAISDGVYTSGEEKNCNFTGSDISHIRLICEDAINVTNIEWWIEPTYVEEEITDDAEAGDSAEIFSLSEIITEAAAAGDSADYFSLSDIAVEAAGAGDSIGIEQTLEVELSESAGAGDSTNPELTLEVELSEAAGAGDSLDGFNWTEFLSQNENAIVTRFYFTLTGAEDSTTDVEIPISSFNCRLRSGDPTYLQVVIPGDDYAAQVAARPNGQMVVEMDYLLSGTSQHREEIVRVDLEDIRTDEGTKKRSISLTGHRTVTHAGKNIALRYVNYTSITNGAMRVRCAEPDMYIRPGDTATYDGDSFVVNNISINVGMNRRSMEVAEDNG